MDSFRLIILTIRPSDSYYINDYEFEYSIEKWEKYRLDSFVIVLLGSLVFPKSREKIDTCLRYMVRDLDQ